MSHWASSEQEHIRDRDEFGEMLDIAAVAQQGRGQAADPPLRSPPVFGLSALRIRHVSTILPGTCVAPFLSHTSVVLRGKATIRKTGTDDATRMN